MAHEITEHDTVVLNREQAWHGLGRVIHEDIGAVAACEKYGLNYPVNSWPIYAKNPVTGEYTLIELHQANVRQIATPDGDITSILGVTSDSYRVCQNRELAELTDAIATNGDVTIESCGTIRGGKLVWFLAKGDAYRIGSDEIFPYVLVSNGHDGKQSIKVTPTTIRVVCSNTLHAVLDNKVAAWSTCHLGDVGGKIEAAKLSLAYYKQTIEINRELHERLADVKWNRDDALKLFAQEYSREFAVATDGDLGTIDAVKRRAAERREKRQHDAAQQFLARFDRERKQLKVKTGSAWLALNAWTGYVQHDAKAVSNNVIDRDEQKQKSLLFGLASQRSVRALAGVQELALAT